MMGNRGNTNGLDCDALDRRSRNALKWRRGVVKRAKRAFSRRMRRLNKPGVDNDDAPEITDDMLDRATLVKGGQVIQHGRQPFGNNTE